MEVQGEDAGRTWLDWWRPKQEAGDEVDPASQQKTENTDRTVPKDGTLGLRKLSGKYVGGTMPLLAVISLILLSGVIFRLSTKRDSPKLSPPELRSPQLSSPELSSPQLNPPELSFPTSSSPTSSSPTSSSPTSSSPTLSSNNEWAPLPVSDDTIRRYMDDLKDAEVTMNKAWGSLGPSLKEDFQKHFTPSSTDGQTLTENPLAVITEHVVNMQKCEFPSDSSAKVQNDFLQHLRLLVTICRMATLRLEELDRLLPWKSEIEAPVDFPDNEEADSNFGLPSLKEDFQKHFTPSSTDGQTLTENPLAVFTEHVVNMQKCEFPSDSSAKVQNDFLQHVRLLVTICRMATLRLRELDRLVLWKTATEAPIDFPDNEEAD
ncbi:hypothetical protein EMWEY_00031750, partial [Eimeria maxima]